MSAITLNSCDKDECPPDRNEYEEISPYYRQILQGYSGADTLKFKSETGITYTFYGDQLDSGYNTVIDPIPDCHSVIWYHERFYRYFFDRKEYHTDMQVYVTRRYQYGIELHIEINKNIFVTNADLDYHKTSYLNGFMIDGNAYDSVIKIYRNWDPLSSGFLYYSVKEGIIKISFDNGKTLTKTKQ